MNERQIFEAALEIKDQKERKAFLEKICGGNQALRSRIEKLLQSLEISSDFLGVPAPQELAAANDPLESSESMKDAFLRFLEPSTRLSHAGAFEKNNHGYRNPSYREVLTVRSIWSVGT